MMDNTIERLERLERVMRTFAVVLGITASGLGIILDAILSKRERYDKDTRDVLDDCLHKLYVFVQHISSEEELDEAFLEKARSYFRNLQ